MDTGAEEKAISQESFQRLGQVSLKKSMKVVYGPKKLRTVLRSYIIWKKLIEADNICDSWSQSQPVRLSIYYSTENPETS